MRSFFTRRFPTAALLAIFLLTADHAGIADNGPGPNERNISRIVAQLLQQLHISHRPVDDVVSVRAFQLFAEALDHRKLYFTQSDMDEFSANVSQMDDMVLRGDVEPAFAMHRRLVTRMEERQDLIEQLLGAGFDFSVDEDIVVDPDVTTYAASVQEIRDRWRRELKWQYLLQSTARMQRATPPASKAVASESPEEPDPIEQLRTRYRERMNRMRRMDSEKICELFLSSIAGSYDPHTTYMSPASLKQFMIQMSLNLEGIGAELREENGWTTITRVMEGGAASKEDAIEVGDKILAIAQGKNAPWSDVAGQSVDQIATQILGKAGTALRMRLQSRTGELKEVGLVRSRVELKEKGASGHIIPLSAQAQNAPRIGYLDLPSFYKDIPQAGRSKSKRSCSKDVADILDRFQNQDVDAVLLDLRGNGGGYLDEAVKIVGHFIDHGPVVQVKESGGSVQTYEDTARGVAWDGPLLVLVDSFSASASEIVAGAIQDYARGVVVGDRKTHGKGTVQSPVDLASYLLGQFPNAPSLGALKVTMQTYYLPSGRSTQIDGVTAHVPLPSTSTFAPYREERLQFVLPKDRVPSTTFKKVDMTPHPVLSRLRRASERRVQNSPELQQTTQRMDAIRVRTDQKYRSLLKSKFELAQKLFLNQDEDVEQDEKLRPSQFPRNEYEEEVVNIVQDYIGELAKIGKSNVS